MWRGAWAAVCVALLAAGCGDPGTGPGVGGTGRDAGNGGGGGPLPGDAPKGPWLRVVHAAPDLPAVDVYVEGLPTPLATDVAFLETTGELRLPPGPWTVELRLSGAAADSVPSVRAGPLTLAAGDVVTVVAAGLLGGSEPESALRLLPLREGFGPVGTDAVRVRVVHASPDAPPLGLDVEDDERVELPALPRFADSGAEGLLVPAERLLSVAVRADGVRLTGLVLPALPAGASLLAIATGELEGAVDGQRGFGVLLVGPEGTVGFVRQNPFVYLLNTVPDVTRVDVFAGGIEVASDLTFGALSARLQVPPGAHALELFTATPGATRPAGAPLASDVLELREAGETYLVEAVGLRAPDGDDAPPTIRLLALETDFGRTRAEGAEADTLARLRVVHASPDAPPVDAGWVELSGFTRAVTALPYLGASNAAGEELSAPAERTLGVAFAGGDLRATFPLVLEPGERAFAFATGRLLPEGDDARFQLQVVRAPPSHTVGGVPWTVTSVPAAQP